MSTRHKSSQETDDEAIRSGDGAGSLRLREVENAAVVSRRGVLWRMGLATVGGVGALTALSERRAEAATAGNFILGQANDANATTSLAPTSLSSPYPALMQINGSALNATTTTLIVNGPSGSVAVYAAGVSTSTTTGLAINGTGTGTASGVYGASGSGTGVTGGSSSGTGAYGYSSTGGVGVRGFSGTNSGVVGSSGSTPAGKAKTGVYGYAAQDIFSSGVIGESPAGVGVRGHTTTGYAGYFEGRIYTNAFYEMTEISTPAAPITNRARLFVKDNGLGKTQLCVRFNTGAVQVIKTQP